MAGHRGVLMNRGAARALGIEDGEPVIIESVVGETQGRAVLREGVRPDTVVMIGQFDHWVTPFAKDLGLASLNSVTPMALSLTDSTGSVADLIRVQVRRAGAADLRRHAADPAAPAEARAGDGRRAGGDAVSTTDTSPAQGTPRYGMVVDLNRCVGCQTCTIACKHHNDTPPGVQWRGVLDVEQGEYPNVERVFLVTGCQHCANPPCVPVCPTGGDAPAGRRTRHHGLRHLHRLRLLRGRLSLPGPDHRP